MRLRSKEIVGVLAVLVIVVSCTRHIEKQDLYGIYEVEYPHGRESLVLNSDGTYEQHYLSKEGGEVANVGKWEAEGKNLEIVYLNNALLFDDHFGRRAKSPPKSGWQLEVRTSNGGITLNFNPDHDFAFIKKEPASAKHR